MVTLSRFSAQSRHAAACAAAVLLSACGGGSSGAGAGGGPGAATPTAVGVPAPASANGAVPVAPPQADPSGVTPVAGGGSTAMAPVPDAAPAPIAMAAAAAAGGPDAVALVVTVGAPVPTPLPDGATPCQPGTCPPFSANGSVTNTHGSTDPTAAHGYVMAPGPSSGGYPDLGNLPTLILPFVPVTVGTPAT